VTRIFFSAGESSGDIHGANLIRALQDVEPDLASEGLGGQRMACAGMAVRHDLASKGLMGFTEVVKSFPMIRRVFRATVAHLARTRPDCLVVIDYPGFNIRLAQAARALGIPVVYYISPQVWAWRKERIYTIASIVQKILVILPFEEDLYKELDVDCTYVGHPLLDHIASMPPSERYTKGLVIGLFPGSREQEVRRLTAPMIEVASGIRKAYAEARFVAPCVNEKHAVQIRNLAGRFPLETAVGSTYDLLFGARFCLVASGTATLEAALFGVPMVILYRISALSHWIAKRIVHVDHIGLVNILAGRRIVPEFVQNDVRAENILPATLSLVDDTPARAKMIADLAAVREGLGGPGASARAANEILAVVARRSHG